MRIVATDTVEFPPWPSPLAWSGHRMATHRMSASDTGQPGMTTDAELVDRLIKHIRIVAGMGIVAGHTAGAFDDAVHDWHLVFAIDQFLLVAVAGNAQFQRALGPELPGIITAMGIVAQGAAAGIHRTMEEGLGPPDFFAGMAG